MGYMRHHAILVTTFNPALAENLYERALILFGGNVSPIMISPINGYATFIIPPDGSKESWQPSYDGDNSRADFIRYLETFRHEDHSSPIDWVEIQYGDTQYETKISNGYGIILNDSDKMIRENQHD